MMGALPTKDKLKRRNIPIHNDLCPLCNDLPETIPHLLTKCRITTSIWNLQDIVVDMDRQHPIELLSDLLRRKDGNILSLVVSTLWSIWVARCQVIFKNSTPNITQIRTRALQLQQELQLLTPQFHMATTTAIGTMYVDAAIGQQHSAWAVVAMTSTGKFLHAWADFAPLLPPYQAECRAIRKALDIIDQQGWKQWRIASDCAQAVAECLTPMDLITIQEGAYLTEEIKSRLQTNHIELIYIPRDSNLLAHHLAKYALDNTCSIVDIESTIPSCIKHLIE